MTNIDICDAVYSEFYRATDLHAPFNSAHEGYAVLLEEVDELWAEVMKNPHKGCLTPADKAEGSEKRMTAMRTEAIQVAAMAMRFLKDVC